MLSYRDVWCGENSSLDFGPAREIRGWLALERWKEATVKAARFEPSIAGRVGVWRGRGRRGNETRTKPQLFGGGEDGMVMGSVELLRRQEQLI